MTYLEQHFKAYDCDTEGNVFKNGKPISQCNSNGYKQVTMRDENFKRRILGVHVVVAMKYLDYYDGCIVHHKDEDKSNNNLDNLEVLNSPYHKSYHAKRNTKFSQSAKDKEPWNKGMKMSDEFRQHCRDSALKRIQRDGFYGNQFVDRNGNRK